MRRTILAVPALCLLMLGCQQNNDEVLKRLAELETKREKGSDDAFKTWLMTQGSGSGIDDKRWTTFKDDFQSELSKISKSIEATRTDNKRQIDDLDSRVQKLGNVETSLGSLKTMIESLEGKVKAVDPNQALELHKQLYGAEYALKTEQQAHQEALKTIESLKSQLATVQKELDETKQQIVGLTGEDISRHPQYIEMKRALAQSKSETELARSDFDNLNKRYAALEAQLRKGSGTTGEEKPIRPLAADYDFTGDIDSVRLIPQTGQAVILVNVRTGRVPAVNTEMIVLDDKNQRLCSAKVDKHYHQDDNPEWPVNMIGVVTIDHQLAKPVSKGDMVVWKEVKDAQPNPANSASKTGDTSRKAGGD